MKSLITFLFVNLNILISYYYLRGEIAIKYYHCHGSMCCDIVTFIKRLTCKQSWIELKFVTHIKTTLLAKHCWSETLFGAVLINLLTFHDFIFDDILYSIRKKSKQTQNKFL